jgi:hypothetical protein
MAFGQRFEQDSGIRIQERLWERASWQEKHREVCASAQTKRRVLYEREKKDSLKLNERGGNLYEKKGSAFSSPWRSGNVTENKGSYALKAGMSLKRKGVKR